jgi:hypothetical protein
VHRVPSVAVAVGWGQSGKLGRGTSANGSRYQRTGTVNTVSYCAKLVRYKLIFVYSSWRILHDNFTVYSQNLLKYSFFVNYMRFYLNFSTTYYEWQYRNLLNNFSSTVKRSWKILHEILTHVSW